MSRNHKINLIRSLYFITTLFIQVLSDLKTVNLILFIPSLMFKSFLFLYFNSFLYFSFFLILNLVKGNNVTTVTSQSHISLSKCHRIQTKFSCVDQYKISLLLQYLSLSCNKYIIVCTSHKLLYSKLHVFTMRIPYCSYIFIK